MVVVLDDLKDDLLPGSLIRHPILHRDIVGFARAPVTHRLRQGELGREEVELSRVEKGSVRERCLDLGEHLVIGAHGGSKLLEAIDPWAHVRIVGIESVHRFLQSDVAPEGKLLHVILGTRTIEVLERAVEIATVVQHIAEVDLSLGVVGVQLQRAPEPPHCGRVITQPMCGIPQAGRGFGRVRMCHQHKLEEIPRVIEHPLAEKGPPHLLHQVMVLAKPQGQDRVEALQGPVGLPDLQQNLA